MTKILYIGFSKLRDGPRAAKTCLWGFVKKLGNDEMKIFLERVHSADLHFIQMIHDVAIIFSNFVQTIVWRSTSSSWRAKTDNVRI